MDPVWAGTDWTLARAVRTARFWWLAFGLFCGLYVWYAVQVHQTKYLIEIGFSPGVAAWALGLVSLLGIPGQIALAICPIGSAANGRGPPAVSDLRSALWR